MLRPLILTVLGGMCLVAMTDQSFAGATGKSFEVEVSDGTDAAAAFNPDGTVLVHVPGADVTARYFEFGTGFFVPSTIFAIAITDEYAGFFFANCRDPLDELATINGSGFGTTGGYTFVGVEK